MISTHVTKLSWRIGNTSHAFAFAVDLIGEDNWVFNEICVTFYDKVV